MTPCSCGYSKKSEGDTLVVKYGWLGCSLCLHVMPTNSEAIGEIFTL